MAVKIYAVGDEIKIQKAFVSGKDRVLLNGDVVFEGKTNPDTPVQFSVGARQYQLETRIISKMMKTMSYHLQIYEEGQLAHSGIYDQFGKLMESEKQAKASGAIHACSMVGAVIGFAVMMGLNSATGVVPGGAIGGGIGGGVGGAFGYGVGSLLFGRK